MAVLRATVLIRSTAKTFNQSKPAKRTQRRYCSTFIPPRTRRSRRCLFNIPGSEERKINKALTTLQNADSLVFDLEDGVALSKKEHARELVCKTLKETKRTVETQERVVRINSFDSPFYAEDMAALADVLPYLDAILLPKAESAHQIRNLAKSIASGFKDDIGNTVKILPAIESANALLNLNEILMASPMVDAVVFGSEDYCADVGITRTNSLMELHYARSAIVTHAAALGLPAIDLVCVDYKDPEQLAKECVDGYNMGFVGKQAIHPNQVDIINTRYCPPDKDIEFAKAIIIENDKHQRKGKGAWEINGKMIDMPMVRWATNTLARASISKEDLLENAQA